MNPDAPEEARETKSFGVSLWAMPMVRPLPRVDRERLEMSTSLPEANKAHEEVREDRRMPLSLGELEAYVQHTSKCAKWGEVWEYPRHLHPEIECTCGLADVLALLRAQVRPDDWTPPPPDPELQRAGEQMTFEDCDEMLACIAAILSDHLLNGETHAEMMRWKFKQLAGRSAVPETATYPIPLNDTQEHAAKEWAADDRLWTTQETVEINLRTFARVILRDATGQSLSPRTDTIGHTLLAVPETPAPDLREIIEELSCFCLALDKHEQDRFRETMKQLREAVAASPGVRPTHQSQEAFAIMDKSQSTLLRQEATRMGDYDALDPGIRETVRLLNALGFHTTDSGDGVSKPPEWYQPDERGITQAMPFPHVVVAATPFDVRAMADKLAAVLGPEWEIEAVYRPRQHTAHVMVSQMLAAVAADHPSPETETL